MRRVCGGPEVVATILSANGGVLTSLRLARILRLTRLLKMFRLVKLSRLRSKLEEQSVNWAHVRGGVWARGTKGRSGR